jgi:nucleotide-binding universal stress UspA family protein
LTLLHVVEWPWHEPPPPDLRELPAQHSTALAEFRRDIENSATERLNALIPEVVREQRTTVTRVVHGKSYVELLRVAAEEGVDLIVMGVHGHNAVDAMLFGSTTNQVGRRATCPVVTLALRQAG